MKKSYIYPQTEVLPVLGTAVMLGASGDIHSGNTEQGDQTQNHAPRRIFLSCASLRSLLV